MFFKKKPRQKSIFFCGRYQFPLTDLIFFTIGKHIIVKIRNFCEIENGIIKLEADNAQSGNDKRMQ